MCMTYIALFVLTPYPDNNIQKNSILRSISKHYTDFDENYYLCDNYQHCLFSCFLL
jgi:hypothetical protein